MGQIQKTSPVKLINGFIFRDEAHLKKLLQLLKKLYGDIDFASAILPFRHTDYYSEELGPDLKRKFISFKKLIQPHRLAGIKIKTNRLENKFSESGKRSINIDPGYLDLSKLVLASTKDFSHRIYLSQGIYAEVTLYFQNKSFRHWEWTYPDYKSSEYIAIFNSIRGIFNEQVKSI